MINKLYTSHRFNSTKWAGPQWSDKSHLRWLISNHLWLPWKRPKQGEESRFCVGTIEKKTAKRKIWYAPAKVNTTFFHDPLVVRAGSDPGRRDPPPSPAETCASEFSLRAKGLNCGSAAVCPLRPRNLAENIWLLLVSRSRVCFYSLCVGTAEASRQQKSPFPTAGFQRAFPALFSRQVGDARTGNVYISASIPVCKVWLRIECVNQGEVCSLRLEATAEHFDSVFLKCPCNINTNHLFIQPTANW